MTSLNEVKSESSESGEIDVLANPASARMPADSALTYSKAQPRLKASKQLPRLQSSKSWKRSG